MSEQPKREKREVPISSPYCSNPNCLYCKELREMQEQMGKKNEKRGGAA
jgi:hypothetical protein